MIVTFADIEDAARRLEGVANKTPVLTSRTFNDLTGCQGFFKAENYQRGGAFKFRGAYNAFSQLTDEQKRNGVLTFSSGNHGAACALAGRILSVPVVVVMNHDAPSIKKSAVAGYGAEVVLYERDEQVREELGARIAQERGMIIIPPYDHPNIVAGQGTAGKEFFEEVPDLDVLVVGCGGGGLLSGCSIAAKHFRPNIEIYGVEPEAGNDGQLSLKAGHIVKIANPNTIADGARTPSLGNLTFSIIKENVNKIVTVNDEELLMATRFLFERMKTVVEPTGALATAAVMEKKINARGKRVGLILTGGNVDLASLFSCE